MFVLVSTKERVYTPQFNDISMKLPSFPLLSQFNDINPDTFCDHQTLRNCNVTFCECTNVINIPLGNVVEIILVDKGKFIILISYKDNLLYLFKCVLISYSNWKHNN